MNLNIKVGAFSKSSAWIDQLAGAVEYTDCNFAEGYD